MNALPNLFDPTTRQQITDLYGKSVKRTVDEFQAQVELWLAQCDEHHTPAEIAQIEADQARRIAAMRNR